MILALKIGKHTKQGLKRKYEQMEWQNEQIRFSSNSGVFGVGGNGNYQGGVLMTQQMMWCLIVPTVLWITIKAVSDAYELYYIVKCDKDRDMGFDDE